jgi:protein-S-isoprenylcysteine O-methyltransferase Ste14
MLERLLQYYDVPRWLEFLVKVDMYWWMIIASIIFATHQESSHILMPHSNSEEVKCQPDFDVGKAFPGFLKYGDRVLKVSRQDSAILQAKLTPITEQTVLYTIAITEIIVMTPTIFPSALHYIPPIIAASILDVSSRLHISLPFVFSLLAICVGSVVQDLAYRHLRERLPSKFIPQEDQALEVEGIYSVVRHLAYTGSLILVAGAYCCVHDQGSLLAAIGLWDSTWRTVVDSVLFMLSLTGGYCLRRRTRMEQKMLQRRFGEQRVS